MLIGKPMDFAKDIELLKSLKKSPVSKQWLLDSAMYHTFFFSFGLEMIRLREE